MKWTICAEKAAKGWIQSDLYGLLRTAYLPRGTRVFLPHGRFVINERGKLIPEYGQGR